MIIWHGRGFLIAVVGFGCLVAMELFTRAWFHDDTYYQRHGWPMLVGLLVAAGLIWLLARSWGTDASAESGQDSPEKISVLREEDRLFFISPRHWPQLLGALGIVCYIVSFFAPE
jgi:hypothetical protein